MHVVFSVLVPNRDDLGSALAMLLSHLLYGFSRTLSVCLPFAIFVIPLHQNLHCTIYWHFSFLNISVGLVRTFLMHAQGKTSDEMCFFDPPNATNADADLTGKRRSTG